MNYKEKLEKAHDKYKGLTTRLAVLNKLEIKYTDYKKEKKSFMFQYNPSKLEIVKKIEWSGVDGNQQDVSLKQFATGKAKTLKVSEVVFDTSMLGNSNVYTNFIMPLEAMTLVQPYKTKKGKVVKRPPFLTLSWGKGGYFFECVLESLSYDFTMFDRDGVPIRADVTLEFEEIVPETKKKKIAAAKQSVKTYKVKRFDTLHSIAESEYGDMTKWKIIAIANGVDNPADVEIGITLTIPELV